MDNVILDFLDENLDLSSMQIGVATGLACYFVGKGIKHAYDITDYYWKADPTGRARITYRLLMLRLKSSPRAWSPQPTPMPMYGERVWVDPEDVGLPDNSWPYFERALFWCSYLLARFHIFTKKLERPAEYVDDLLSFRKSTHINIWVEEGSKEDSEEFDLDNCRIHPANVLAVIHSLGLSAKEFFDADDDNPPR